jgi:hypothetical protein
MIGKVMKPGSGARGCLNYNFSHGELLGGSMIGQDARSLAKEFNLTHSQLPGRKKYIFHASVALKPGETLSDDQLLEAGHDYAKGMGYSDGQYCIFKHNNRDHLHIHVVGSRVDLSGQWINNSHEYKRSEKICRELEAKFGLQEVQSSDQAARHSLTKGELEQAKRLETVPPRQAIADSIDAVLGSTEQPIETSFEQFKAALAERGITAKLNLQTTGRCYGISFEQAGVAFAGGKIGNAYTLGSLKDRGLSLETQDHSVLQNPEIIEKINKITNLQANQAIQAEQTQAAQETAQADQAQQIENNQAIQIEQITINDIKSVEGDDNMDINFDDVLQAARDNDIPAGSALWSLAEGGRTIAHVAATFGFLPPGFNQWDLTNQLGDTVAHTAARNGNLPPSPYFNQWGLEDRNGDTVAHTAARNGNPEHPDPANRIAAQAWLDSQQQPQAAQAEEEDQQHWSRDKWAEISYGTKTNAHSAAISGTLPANFKYWDIVEPNGYSQDTVAHMAATYGHLPDNFNDWSLTNAYGYTVAHTAARSGRLPAKFDQWGLTDRHGKSVAEEAVENSADQKNQFINMNKGTKNEGIWDDHTITSPAHMSAAQAWLDSQQQPAQEQSSTVEDLDPVQEQAITPAAKAAETVADQIMSLASSLMPPQLRKVWSIFLQLAKVCAAIGTALDNAITQAQQADKINDADFGALVMQPETGRTVAHVAATYDALPDGFNQWELTDKNGVTVAQEAEQAVRNWRNTEPRTWLAASPERMGWGSEHIGAVMGTLPADFGGWHHTDWYGQSVAEAAAIEGTLPDDFDQWHIAASKPYDAETVAHSAIRSEYTSPALRDAAQTWIDTEYSNWLRQSQHYDRATPEPIEVTELRQAGDSVLADIAAFKPMETINDPTQVEAAGQTENDELTQDEIWAIDPQRDLMQQQLEKFDKDADHVFASMLKIDAAEPDEREGIFKAILGALAKQAGINLGR